MGRVWEGYGKGMGRVWEGHGKGMGRVWEGYGKGGEGICRPSMYIFCNVIGSDHGVLNYMPTQHATGGRIIKISLHCYLIIFD